MRLKLLLVCTLVLLAIPLQAQMVEKPWTFHTGFGYPFTIGSTSDAAKPVFHFLLGATKNFSPQLGLRIDGEYDRFYPTDRIVQAYEATGGNANIWSVSANLQYNFGRLGGGYPYMFGGVGTHYKQVYLHNPGVGWWCDPWWGVCYPASADVITDKKSDTAFGANAGMGMSIDLISGSQLFLETKYQWVNGDKEAAQFIPLTIGWRW